MVQKVGKTKGQTMLFTLVFITQIAWSSASLDEALDLLNRLRQNVLGNKNTVSLTGYPGIAPKSWQEMKWIPKDRRNGISEGILKFYRLYMNENVAADFNQQIELTRTNQTKGKYTLGRSIADGTQGEVFLGCTTTGLEKNVAVKMIKLSSEKVEKEAYREAGLYAEMDREIDGVSVMIDYGTLEKGDHNYFVMVFDLLDVEVYDLLTLCGGSFSLATSITLIRQLLKTVQEFHSVGIVHRDLKAENLMLNLPTQTSPLKLRVVDFGKAEHYPLNPLERVEVNTYEVAGTADTMSIFTHRGNAPHPRDDLLSAWYILAIFIDSWLPWDKLLPKLNDLRISKADTMKLILEMKEQTSSELQLVRNYPELTPFIQHILGLKMEDNPDYALLDSCLEAVMNKYVVNYNWKFDWEVKGHMLFQDPNVFFISTEHKPSENSFKVRFEAFYDSLIAEIIEKRNGGCVQVMEELNSEANMLLQTGERLPCAYFTNEILQSSMQNLALANFENWSEDALSGLGVLFAGFSYICSDFTCHVIMVLKSNKEIWENLSDFRLPVPYLQGIWETKKMNDIANMICHPVLDRPVDKSRYKHVVVNVEHIPLNSTSLLENVQLLRDENAELVNRNEIAEMGLNLTTVKTNSGSKHEIMLVYRQSYNFLEFASHEYIENGLKFSWSVDESGFDDRGQNSPLDANNELKRFIVPNAKVEDAYKIPVNESNWKLAMKLAVKDYSSTPNLDKQMMNVRVKWQQEVGQYTFTFIQDVFYKTFLTGENPPKFQYGANWLTGRRITEGDFSLRQLANTIAGEMGVQRRLGVEYRNGLIILSTTVDAERFNASAIFELMSMLRSEAARETADIVPETIGSAVFGYSLTKDYIYGVAIFETLGNTFLKLVNNNRFKIGITPLSFFEQNNIWTKETMRKYSKGRLVSKSGNLLRASANIDVPMQDGVALQANVGESSNNTKGKNPLSSSRSWAFPFSKQKESSSKNLLNDPSSSFVSDVYRGEDGVHRFNLPKSREVSIQETIESFWKNDSTTSVALSSPEYKTINVAVFTGSETTKVVYQLHKDANERVRI